jgi:DNA-binding CsgD family transcriptional regulator
MADSAGFQPEPNEKFVGIRMTGGHVGLVSLVDAHRVRAKRWYRIGYTRKDGTRNLYAKCQSGGSVVLMHRFLLGLTSADKIFVDHINGNGLDNRRENLRLASHAENMRNRRPDKRARLLEEQSSAGQTPVFFDSLRASDGEQQEIAPLEVWDFAGRQKAPKPIRPLLSAGELTVIRMLSEGFEIKEIAGALKLSCKTVSTAKARASAKLKVRSSSNPVPLVDAARALGLLNSEAHS